MNWRPNVIQHYCANFRDLHVINLLNIVKKNKFRIESDCIWLYLIEIQKSKGEVTGHINAMPWLHNGIVLDQLKQWPLRECAKGKAKSHDVCILLCSLTISLFQDPVVYRPFFSNSKGVPQKAQGQYASLLPATKAIQYYVRLLQFYLCFLKTNMTLYVF